MNDNEYIDDVKRFFLKYNELVQNNDIIDIAIAVRRQKPFFTGRSFTIFIKQLFSKLHSSLERLLPRVFAGVFQF